MKIQSLSYLLIETTDLQEWADYAKDVVGLIFNTIGVSDGISMGTPGMRFSLPSRDVIADSMETVVQAMSYDGMITVVGCDKNMPGALMAMIRVNKPSILVYGGTIDSGCHNGQKLDIVSAFEAWGSKVAGTMEESEFQNIVQKACPGAGACGGMYTANTMACAIEALGMSLTNSSAQVAISPSKKIDCKDSAKALMKCVKRNIVPKDIITKKSKFLAANVQINAANKGYHSLLNYKKVDCVIINESELRSEMRNREDNIKILIKNC